MLKLIATPYIESSSVKRFVFGHTCQRLSESYRNSRDRLSRAREVAQLAVFAQPAPQSWVHHQHRRSIGTCIGVVFYACTPRAGRGRKIRGKSYSYAVSSESTTASQDPVSKIKRKH